MAAFIEEKDRTVIPRWRLFAEATSLGELDIPNRESSARFNPNVISKSLHDWAHNRDIWHAGDLISAAVVIDRPELGREAAEYLLSHRDEASSSAASLAELVSGRVKHRSSGEPNWKKLIHNARHALNVLPRNPVLWTNLALGHTVLGNFDQAKRAITVALGLAPENRFILRSAVRFYVHVNDIGKAQAILNKAPRTRLDPWLLAAELAVASAQNKHSKLTKPARAMIERENFHPSQTSELASALATIELRHGAERKAKALFRQSLVAPTENSAAQAKWSVAKTPSVLSPGDKERLDQLDVPRLFEMRALGNFNSGHFEEAMQYALLWLQDQPFSVRPAYLAAYLADLIGENEKAIAIGEGSLPANPDDWLLLNNLVFHLASGNRIVEANEILCHLDTLELPVECAVVVEATRGLVAYRSEEFDRGRSLYLHAIDEAVKHKLPKQLGVAAIFLAREELLANGQRAMEFFSWAHKFADAFEERDVQEWLRQLDEQFHKARGTIQITAPSAALNSQQ